VSAAAVPLSIASAGIGMYQSYQDAQAAKARGKYEQQVSESNARMAEFNAEDALTRGRKESNQQRLKGRNVQGAQRAAFAGQGVDVNTGTAASIQNETATLSELDAQTIANNAWKEAWGYRTQASDYRFEGRMKRLASKNEARNTLLSGGLNFASSLGQAAYKYSDRGAAPKYTPKNPTEERFATSYGWRK